MDETAKVKETVRLYRKLWRFPSAKVIFSAAIITLVIGSIIITFLTKGVVSESFLISSVMYFGIILFIPPIIDFILAFGQRNVLSLRRFMAISYINFIMIIIFTIIAFPFYIGTMTGYAKLLLFSIGFNTSLRFLAILAMWRRTDIFGILASASHGLIALTSAKILDVYNALIFDIPTNWLIIGFLIMCIFAISESILFYRVNKPFIEELNVSGLTFFRGFSAVYLANEPKLFEEAMDKIGENQDLKISRITIWNENSEKYIGSIIVPEVHPGPFREVGSSAMPVRIIEALEDDTQAISVVHGTCTHAQNLTKSEQIQTLIDSLKSMNKENISEDIHEIVTTQHNQFKFVSWRIGNKIFLITTRAPEPTDDIELELGKKAIDNIRTRIPDAEEIIIVDAHNCIVQDTPSLSADSEEAADFIDACTRAAEIAWNTKIVNTQIGTAQNRNLRYSLDEGFGKGGITVFSIMQKGKKIALISIDGNNANCEFRKHLITKVKERGYDIVELMTSDTHTVNAISMNSKGYLPVGTIDQEQLITDILELLDIAEKNTQDAKIMVHTEINKLKVYGRNGFERLTKCVVKAAHIAKNTGIAVSLIAMGLSIIILMMI